MKIQYNVAVGKFTWLNAKIYINGGVKLRRYTSLKMKKN